MGDKGPLYNCGMSFGANLKRYRLKAELTQRALGTLLKITPQAVSQWERGETVPEFARISSISKQLKVPLDTLLPDGDNTSKGDDFPADDWERLAPNQQRQVRRLMKSMVDDKDE